jgi:hypothetical protein
MINVFDHEFVVILDHVNVFLVQEHLALVLKYLIHRVNFVFQYQIFLKKLFLIIIKKKIKIFYDEVHLMLLLNHDFHFLIV